MVTIVTPTSAWSGFTERAPNDQFEVPLRVSDIGTLGAPARVLPVARTSGFARLVKEGRFHRAVWLGPKVIV